MTSQQFATRRMWLGTLVGVLGSVGGCSTRSDTEPSSTETATTETPTATTAQEAPTTQSVETATEPTTEPTPSPDRETPTATPSLNQTNFAVRQLFGPDDDYSGTRGPSVGGGRVRVQLVTDRADWEAVYREIEAETGVSYEGLPFVSETTFGPEVVVVVWVEMSDSENARLVGITREDGGTVRLRVTGTGNFGAQVNVGRVLLVRVPNAQRVRRAVAEYTGEGGHVATVIEPTGSETETATVGESSDRTTGSLVADTHF